MQGVSSYIEEAVRRQLQREAVDEYIAAAEAEHGPVDPAEVAARADRIRAHHAARRGGGSLPSAHRGRGDLTRTPVTPGPGPGR